MGAESSRSRSGGITTFQTEARAARVLYLITFVTSIPPLLLFQPVLDDPAATSPVPGTTTGSCFGALLELLLIVAYIGTAVVIVPIIRR